MKETQEEAGFPSKKAITRFFKALYILFLDQERGPRLGPFLANVDQKWILERLTA